MKGSSLYESIMALMRRAGDIMLSAQDVDAEGQVGVKPGDANFVTAYDLRVQEVLMDGIRALLPDAVFVAEEKENDFDATTAEHCFIIDPIDGTTNFICDYRGSCISLAYVSFGEILFGAIFDPYLNEMFSAQRGRGAFCNGKPIHVSSRPLSRGLVMFGSSPYNKEELADRTFLACKRLFLVCADLRRNGSCALGLAHLAAGRVDVAFEYRVYPWDIAAGMLLVSEAGGVCTDMKGAPLSLGGATSVFAATKQAYDAALAQVQ